MSIAIRTEQPSDLDAIRVVNRHAFGQDQEGRIVDALREGGGVLLSLVATIDGDVAGHILFTSATAGTQAGAALGPMAVLPDHQGRGIGSQLVTRGLDHLRNRQCPFVVVIGHPGFYRRFGFQPAGRLGLTCDWDVPPDAFMVNLLQPGVERQLRGRVAYRSEYSTMS